MICIEQLIVSHFQKLPGDSQIIRTILAGIAFLTTATVFAGQMDAEIDALIKDAEVTPRTPGAAVLVIQDGEVLFEKCYGLANLGNRTPIRRETTFELASMSKTFTGVAIGLLKDQGQLKFDDPVRKHISEFPHESILISDLLHHTSGLSDYTDWPEPRRTHPDYADNEDFVRLMVQKPKFHKLQFSIRERYDYSNTNYLLLAVIASRIKHQSFSKFMHEEIFQPLGMKHTWIYDHPTANLKHPTLGDVNALGYEKNEEGKWEASWGSPPFRHETMLTCGDGSVWTSLEDLVLWDKAVRSRQLIHGDTWNEALTPSKTRDGETNDYGYGWGLEFNKKGELISFGHDGSWGGFETVYNHYPQANRSIIVLSNRGDFSPSDVADQIELIVNRERRRGLPQKKRVRNKDQKPPVE